MTPKKYTVTWKTILLSAIGLAAFFLYIYIFNIDLVKVIATVQSINLFFYTLALVATLMDTFFFALAWYFLLKFLSVKISIAKANLFVWIGNRDHSYIWSKQYPSQHLEKSIC